MNFRFDRVVRGTWQISFATIRVSGQYFGINRILLLRRAFNEGEATEGEAASTSTRNDDKPQIPVSLNQT
jgi:hypothetical protein